jgi:F0F1-type ATP synthase assembly protein I
MPDNKLGDDPTQPEPPCDLDEAKRKSDREGYRWMGYSVEFIGVIGLFMWLGYLADQKLQTSGPWWMLTGFIVAFVGMIYLLLKETGSIK